MFSKMQANGNNKAAAKRETPRLKTSTPQIINREIPSIILLEQARRDPSQMNPAGILQLQRAIGNQSLQRFLQDQMENSESFDTAIMRQARSATGQATVPQLENWPDVSSDNDAPDGNWAGTKERPDLRFGVQGKDVVYLQRRLLLYGFDLVEDGIFGAKTQKAVMAFQRDYAPPADGVVGPITWAALDRSPNLAASGQQKGPASQVGFVGGTPGVAAPGATSKVPDVFGSLVARDLIDREIADLLNEMYQIGGWAQESAHFAHTELSNGNLIGLVSAANSMTKIQPRLHKKHHADLASFAAGMMTTNGGQMKGFEETGGYLRGLILFGPPRLIAAATSKAEREFTYLLLAHELTHHRNRVQGARLMKEGEKNKLSTSIYVDPKLANSFPPYFASAPRSNHEIYIQQPENHH